MKRFYLFGVIIPLVSFMVSADAGIAPKRNDNKLNLSYDQKVQTQYSEKKSKNKNDDFAFLFYADSREGPFSNWHQRTHNKFVFKMLENEINNNVKHVIFGGDNVWLGFLEEQWDQFFEIMEQFTDKGINIYPALGNHELILAKILYAVKKWFEYREDPMVRQLSEIKEKRDLEDFLSRDIKVLSEIMDQLEVIMKEESFEKELDKFIDILKEEYETRKRDDLYEGQDAETMIKIADKIYPTAQILSLYRFQDFSFKNRGRVHPAQVEIFRKYVDRWAHLEDIVDKDKTYYSVLLPNEDEPRVKLIILDSNIKNNSSQRTWYERQLQEEFSGPIIAVCHHPIFYDKKDGSNWFELHVLPHLVLTGHHHDYERSSVGDENSTKPPVYIISGSGGAHLDHKTYMKEEMLKKHAFLFNYLRITVKSDYIQIKVFGAEKNDSEFKFKEIDEINLMWK